MPSYPSAVSKEGFKSAAVFDEMEKALKAVGAHTVVIWWLFVSVLN